MKKAEAYLRNGKDDLALYQAWFDEVRAVGRENMALAMEWNKKLRSALREAAKANDQSVKYTLPIYRTYLFSAKESLDDYMIALEWNRSPERRFWLPRRSILLPIVKDIERLINDDLDILTISLPPGSGKTTLKIFVLSWLCGKFPDKPNLDSGHSGSMTQSTYDGVLSILTDKSEYNWADIFPEAGSIITNAKELTIDIGKKQRFSTLTCRAIGASLTGATRCEGLLSADDLVSGIEEAMSKDRLEKKWEAYTNDLKSRKKLGAKELHIATRWSVHDVIGRLERQYAGDPRARFIVIPALNDKGESNFNYQYGVGFDTQFFLDMKENLDDASFRALYMNEPIEREGLLYPEDSLQTYYELPPNEPDAILAVCDTAEGGGDDTVLPVFYQYGQKYYLEDVVCSNALPEVTDGLCIDILLKHKVQKCQFESNAAGGRTADKIEEGIKAGNGRCSISKKRTTTNKETKIIVNSDFVKKNVLFKDRRAIEKGSMYNDFMNKVTGYTIMGKNKHDDTVDALAQFALFTQDMQPCVVEVAKRFF